MFSHTPGWTVAGRFDANNRKPEPQVTGVTTAQGYSDFVLRTLFDIHVLEFAGLEDFAALFAFNEFRLFVAAYDLYARMFARRLHTCVLR
ncbi:MAG TPA: hypothetical protein VE377_05515 [Candidatus Dormibacteraeota bacterium]|nr:hypothetical protein [Candidatus Dormibacteraeota bacterium]